MSHKQTTQRGGAHNTHYSSNECRRALSTHNIVCRAFGDIGNIQGVTTRSQAAKEKVQVNIAVQKLLKGLLVVFCSKINWNCIRCLSQTCALESVDRKFELVPQAGVKPQTSLRPRDPNATAAALRSRATQNTRPSGISLSSLLQNRAESASSKAPSVPPPSPLPDIDSVDSNNPLAASQYANSIYNYYRRVEAKFKVAHDYMQSQVRARVLQQSCT